MDAVNKARGRGRAGPAGWLAALLLLPVAGPASPADGPAPPDGSLSLLGTTVAPASARQLSWRVGDTFDGLSAGTPVLVVNGRRSGPTLCLTAAVHGDELNGIEIVREVVHALDPEELAGAVVGVPVVNLHGFQRASRYLPDRRDLNRFFPGNPTGSSASRIAHAFFTEVVTRCNALVDLHTGSHHRTNLPQLRADLGNPGVIQMTRGFDSMVVVHSRPARGTLRRAAVDAGIPALTMEVGEPHRLQPEEVAYGVRGINGLLNALGMVRRVDREATAEPVYYASHWVRSDQGGMLMTRVRPGDEVEAGQLLGTVTDPITNTVADIIAPESGRVIGMALNQVVMPGYAAFNLGLHTAPPQTVNAAAAALLGPQRRLMAHGELALDGSLPPVRDGGLTTITPRLAWQRDAAGPTRALPVPRLSGQTDPGTRTARIEPLVLAEPARQPLTPQLPPPVARTAAAAPSPPDAGRERVSQIRPASADRAQLRPLWQALVAAGNGDAGADSGAGAVRNITLAVGDPLPEPGSERPGTVDGD